MTVVKDSGERALVPPFTDEHAQLRETIDRWVKAEIVPYVDEWERGARVPARALQPRSRARLPRAQVPGGARRAGRRLRPRRRLGRGARRRRGLGRGRRRARRAHRDRDAAGLQVRHPRSARALPAPGDRRRADRRARDHRARRRLRRRLDPHRGAQGRRRLRRQRVEDLHHQRRPRRLPRLRREDDRGGRPPGDLVPDPRARDARLRGRPASSRRWAGTPPTPASSRSPTSRSRPRTCSARRTAASI